VRLADLDDTLVLTGEADKRAFAAVGIPGFVYEQPLHRNGLYLFMQGFIKLRLSVRFGRWGCFRISFEELITHRRH
jgi:hypothetical protein